jgi:hypothetical protein
MRSLARILPLGLLAVLAAAAVAGCGGVTLDPVAEAATKTADAGSFRFTYALSVGIPQQSQAFSLAGKGSFDAAAKRLSMTLGLEGKELDLIADMSSSPTFYMRLPAGTAKLPAGKSWLSIDLGRLGAQYGVDLGQLTSGGLDPSSSLEALEHGKYSTKVGEEQIDGVETTHYLVTLDVAQFVKDVPAKQRQLVEKATAATGLDSYLVDVWVDGSGLLRRVSFDLGGGKSALFSLTMRLDLSGYGSDVHVDLPPAAEVADGSQYLPKR